MNALSLCRVWRTRLVLSGLLALSAAGAWLTSSIAGESAPPDPQYTADLKALLEAEIVPALRRGIVRTARSRPSSLTIEVTDSPSPYDIGARRQSGGALTVRLSMGYLNLHDMALDAVSLGAALDRPRDLQRYLMYQLALAQVLADAQRRSSTLPHMKTFLEFVDIDSKAMQMLAAQPQWRRARRTVEIESLGWTIALLLVRADPMLAGQQSPARADAGLGAARLAAASGWFPVPPFATALGLAAVERSATDGGSPRAYLCRAAELMADGVDGLRHDGVWQRRLVLDAAVRTRVTDIESQIVAVRRDGECATQSKGLVAQALR